MWDELGKCGEMPPGLLAEVLIFWLMIPCPHLLSLALTYYPLLYIFGEITHIYPIYSLMFLQNGETGTQLLSIPWSKPADHDIHLQLLYISSVICNMND